MTTLPENETDASPILSAVRAARRIGDVRECARLAGECLRVAEAVRDAESAFHAPTAVGLLHLSRAEPNEARPWFDAALDVVRAAKLRWWIGAAYHNAFVAARDAGDCRAAGHSAGMALECYSDTGMGHRIPPLVADVSEGTLTACPSPERAWSALCCWRGTFYNACTARERLIARANAMNAASMLLNRRLFYEAADGFQDALNEAQASNEMETVGICLALASVASSRMQEFRRAARVAADAIRVALSRGETIVAEMAGEARMLALSERIAPRLWD